MPHAHTEHYTEAVNAVRHIVRPRGYEPRNVQMSVRAAVRRVLARNLRA